MKEVKTTVLENGVECFSLDELVVENNTYFYLVNIEDPKDIYIRRQEYEDGIEYLVTLKDMEELSKVLDVFVKKHKK